jgi:UDP-perosamine 4-acetyltransferase
MADANRHSRRVVRAPAASTVNGSAIAIGMSTSSQPSVVVIGAGGHAKVIIELLRAAGEYEIYGCTDPAAKDASVLDVPVLGTDEILIALPGLGIRLAMPAIGDNAARLAAARSARELGFGWANAIGPRATISPSARLGHGIAIMNGAVVNAGTRIADLAIINTGTVVDHDCDIGEAAHIGPGSTLAGKVIVGAGAFVGAGSTVIPGVRIGEGAVVGAGSVVIRNVSPRSVVGGVPAKPLK